MRYIIYNENFTDLNTANYSEHRTKNEFGMLVKQKTMSVLIELSMFPLGKGESVGVFVSRLIKMFENNAVRYKLNPMGTVIETETIEAALELIQQCYRLLEPDCDRVYATVKMDIRKNQVNALDSKIKSIEQRIGKVKQ